MAIDSDSISEQPGGVSPIDRKSQACLSPKPAVATAAVDRNTAVGTVAARTVVRHGIDKCYAQVKMKNRKAKKLFKH